MAGRFHTSGREQRISAEEPSHRGVGALVGGERPSAYRDLLRNRNYRWYFGASLTSSLGDWIGLVALQSLVSSLYADSPRIALFGLGGIMMARLLPSLLIGPVAGVLADRYDRKRLMVVTDLARGGLFVFLALGDNLVTLFALTFAVECLALLFLAAKDSCLPQIVAPRHLEQANQLNVLLAYGTLPLGAVAATAITTISVALGMPVQDAIVAALLIDAVTFFLGAAFLAKLRLPARPRRSDRDEAAGVVQELRDGIRFIRELPLVRSLILGVVGVAFGAGVVVTLGPEFVRASLGRPATDWPRLMTAVGVGLVGGIITVPLLTRRFRKERLFPIFLAATGAIAAIMATLPTMTLAMGFGVALGAAAGPSFVMGYTLLHENTTDDVRGKTFGAFYTGTRVSLFSALAIAPFLAGGISGSLFINGRFLRLDGIRMTIFAGGMVALYSALTAMRGIYRSLRTETGRPLRIPGAPAGNPPTGGVFVTFEGVEGSGKSTQVKALVAALEAEGRDVVITREPGGPPVAERIREVLLDPNAEAMSPRTEALLYAAARAEHVERVVAPALAEGKVVVCDRYVDSSLAYQGFARELGDADVAEINRWGVNGILPDVVVLLDIDAEEGLSRMARRAQAQRGRRGPRPVGSDSDWRQQEAPDRLEQQDLDFHRAVAKGYRTLAKRDRGRFVVVDADNDPDVVARAVRKALHPWLPLPPGSRERPADSEHEAG
ncbi:MAG: dTMP kinase [Egibacteraceae bacterium]